jgi:hypothetical protein
MYAGFALVDHVVPPGAIVVHPKYCEHCANTMIVANGQRYCRPCGARFLLPLDYTDYLALAPDHTHLERDQPSYW